MEVGRKRDDERMGNENRDSDPTAEREVQCGNSNFLMMLVTTANPFHRLCS